MKKKSNNAGDIFDALERAGFRMRNADILRAAGFLRVLCEVASRGNVQIADALIRSEDMKLVDATEADCPEIAELMIQVRVVVGEAWEAGMTIENSR